MCFRDETLWDWYCVSQSLLGFFRLRPLSGLYFTISTNVSMKLLVKCILMQAWQVLSSPLYHILRICYSLRGMHTRRSGVLAPFGRQRLGAGIMSALRTLYHKTGLPHFLLQQPSVLCGLSGEPSLSGLISPSSHKHRLQSWRPLEPYPALRLHSMSFPLRSVRPP